jgi:hypothetical protein
MSKPSRFDFYEKVRIESNDPAKTEINGKPAIGLNVLRIATILIARHNRLQADC